MDSTIEKVALAAEAKVAASRRAPWSYLVLSALAGMYVGAGIVLIFAIGAPLSAASSPFTKAVMGASFGIALSLIVFAGAELFTGNNLILTVGVLTGRTGVADLGRLWLLCFAGNLLGSVLLGWLVVQSGVLSGDPQRTFVLNTVATKMTLPFWPLFARGVLCNWLVCLAVWMAQRTQSETARLILIFWCLFAFIGAGFEHSVANMTLLSIGLFLPHEAPVTWGGFVANLVPVTLGNVVGGAGFVAAMYWLASPVRRFSAAAPATAAPAAVTTAGARPDLSHTWNGPRGQRIEVEAGAAG
ncbi:MAG TPA: formate/nitrite transporter family protein [Chloroflexota bacterium]|jgi:nitrite transporter NirC|nr:formate/nitrite transporter family protein [Chloroflexota bacterium]